MVEVKDSELSLDDRIKNAYAAFICACSPVEKAVKWRAWSHLVRQSREQNVRGAISEENSELQS